MEVIDLALPGIKLIRPRCYTDSRGFFVETYSEPVYAAHGITHPFVQDNHSFSKRGVVRGMHFQRMPGQAKLISVVEGEIYDVVVDIRPPSATFKQWLGVRLNGEAHEQLFIPIGFAHGFCVLSDTAHLFYKVSALYNPAEEVGFRFDDPNVAIDWPVAQPIVSERDRQAPWLHEVI